MTVTITIEVEVEVEVELYHEPASRGARGSFGEQMEPDEGENLSVESFKIIIPKELTSEQEADALNAGWKEIKSDRNQEP